MKNQDKQEDKNVSDYLTKRFYDKNFFYGVGYSNNIEVKNSKFFNLKNLFKILKEKKENKLTAKNVEKISLKNALKAVEELITVSTIHGLPNIVRSERKLTKMLWFIFTLISASLCFYLVVRSVFDYLSFDVTTKIRYINEVPAMFPTITICNSNPFVTKFSANYLDFILVNSSVFDTENNTFTNQNLIDNFDRALYVAQSYAKSEYFSDEQKKALGYSLTDMIISCKYDYFECDLSEFVWFYDFMRGNCFTFNLGINSSGQEIPFKTVSKADKPDGFILELYIGRSDKIKTLTKNKGVNIKIHNYTTLPSTVEGYDAAPGFETSKTIFYKSYFCSYYVLLMLKSDTYIFALLAGSLE